jgi:hypothetical protein
MMRYELKSFTLPASSKTSQYNWDLAFLNEREFMGKYGHYKDGTEGIDNGKQNQ